MSSLPMHSADLATGGKTDARQADGSKHRTSHSAVHSSPDTPASAALGNCLVSHVPGHSLLLTVHPEDLQINSLSVLDAASGPIAGPVLPS